MKEPRSVVSTSRLCVVLKTKHKFAAIYWSRA